MQFLFTSNLPLFLFSLKFLSLLYLDSFISVVSEPVSTMDTRGKTNAEFRNDVNEILERHETIFDQVNATL